ncbi:MAG TPA: hypothetical protein VIU41_01625 [Geobacteraceae bacterium]
MIMALTLLLAQQAECADADSLVPVVDKVVAKTAEKEAVARLALGVDNDGNVMIRYRRTSITLVYGPEKSDQETKERLGLVPPLKESVGIGEMSFKVSFAF